MAALASTFTEIVESLPDDWSGLELDLRIADEQRYVQAATFLATCNAQPHSRSEWHWRIRCAHRFGLGAAVPAVRTSLRLLDQSGIAGELVVRKITSGHVEVEPTWGLPESHRAEFRRIRAQ